MLWVLSCIHGMQNFYYFVGDWNDFNAEFEKNWWWWWWDWGKPNASVFNSHIPILGKQNQLIWEQMHKDWTSASKLDEKQDFVFAWSDDESYVVSFRDKQKPIQEKGVYYVCCFCIAMVSMIWIFG